MKVSRFKPRLHITLFGLGLLWFSFCATTARAQSEQWRRVYTGDDSIIEVDVSSPTFVERRVLRVVFRTTFSENQRLTDKAGASYRTRLETIEFRLNDSNYRLAETTLLDASRKVVSTYQAKEDEGWRAIKAGGMMSRLLNSVRGLPPLGHWKVVRVQFGEGGTLPSAESRRYLEAKVQFALDRAEVGTKICSSPEYKSETMTAQDFQDRLGLSLTSLGIASEKAKALVVKCGSSGWRPPQSLLVKLDQRRALMLWEGVFLELNYLD